MSKRLLVALGGICALLAVLCAEPAAAQGRERVTRAAPVPVASSTVAGTTLTVQPVTPFDHAVVRVAGPKGYAAQVVARDGETDGIVAVDLLADSRAPIGSRLLPEAAAEPSTESLADGLYRYEALFMAGGERQVHTGRFFVEAGSTVSSEQKREQLTDVRQSLETRRTAQRYGERAERRAERNAITDDDWIHLNDLADDGITAVTLDSDGTGVPDSRFWGMENDNDQLNLGRTDDLSLIAYPYLTIDYGGNVGVGTTAPSDTFEVASPSALSSLSLRGLYGAYLRVVTGINSWAIYDADGGVPILGLHGANPMLLTLSPYQVSINGDLSVYSSREVKTDFRAIDSADVLDRISALHIQSWRLTGDPEAATHLGPFAEDFHAAFGFGKDDKHISPGDGVGVALLAIQELTKRIEALGEENRELRGEVARLRGPTEPPPGRGGLDHW